jgi:S-formylglutathione hydrolase FrmB
MGFSRRIRLTNQNSWQQRVSATTDSTMRILGFQRFAVLLWCLALGASLSCHKLKEEVGHDTPRLSSRLRLQDVTFHSAALDRDMQYRVILPKEIAAGQELPTVYLLHGRGESFRDWSNFSDVSPLAEHGLVVVMPEGDSSYYTNAVEHPQDRYEDYIVTDLIRDVGSRFPVAEGRQSRAVAGVSMGGYGAVKLAFRYPQLFAFAGGLSPAVDVPSRPFSIRRPLQWRFHSSIFGPAGSQTRHDNDPFILARSADPQTSPYLYLVCGDQEGLLPANRAIADLLAQRRIPHEFHVVAGGHNWTQWNRSMSALFASLLQHIQL